MGYCSLFVAGSPEPYGDNGNSPTLLKLLTADLWGLVSYNITNMTTSEQKKVMYGVFMFMMNNGYFDNQQLMATALKSVIHILGNAHGLSKTEQDNCLVYFFEHYAQGCSQPMPESYIRDSLIPVVNNWKTVNITVGTDILDAVFDRI